MAIERSARLLLSWPATVVRARVVAGLRAAGYGLTLAPPDAVLACVGSAPAPRVDVVAMHIGASPWLSLAVIEALAAQRSVIVVAAIERMPSWLPGELAAMNVRHWCPPPISAAAFVRAAVAALPPSAPAAWWWATRCNLGLHGR